MFFISPNDVSVMNVDNGLGAQLGAPPPPMNVDTWDNTATIEFSQVTATTWDEI